MHPRQVTYSAFILYSNNPFFGSEKYDFCVEATGLKPTSQKKRRNIDDERIAAAPPEALCAVFSGANLHPAPLSDVCLKHIKTKTGSVISHGG